MSCKGENAATRGVLLKEVVLKISQNSQESTCARVSFLIKLPKPCNLIKKETLAQVFSCEFCENFKNTFFTEYLWWQLLEVYSKLSQTPMMELFAKIVNRFQWLTIFAKTLS